MIENFYHNLILLSYCSMSCNCFFFSLKKEYKNMFQNFNTSSRIKIFLLNFHQHIPYIAHLHFHWINLWKKNLSKSIFIENKGIEAFFIDFYTYSHGVNWLLNISYVCPPFVNVLYNTLYGGLKLRLAIKFFTLN